MHLLVQPRDGLAPLLKAIHKARKSVEMVIFRFDRPELRHALVEAVRRGVVVRALISYTNRGGEKKLRKLESDFLGNGIQVARTADDLVRYHGKMVLIDGKQLWVLSYNFTGIDLRSRGFGVVTHDADLLADAEKLLEADCSRQPYKRGRRSGLVVSPLNSREELARLIKSAKKELLIWDLKVTDREMLRLLRERADAGVTVRVLGKIKGNKLQVAGFRSLRLHTRTIVCDHKKVFIGSQSLRKDELDARREIGVIVHNRAIAKELAAIFNKDWQANGGRRAIAALRNKKVAKKVARQLAKKLPKNLPVKPVVEKVAKAVARSKGVPQKRIEKVVKQVVKESVKAAALEIIEGAVA